MLKLPILRRKEEEKTGKLVSLLAKQHEEEDHEEDHEEEEDDQDEGEDQEFTLRRALSSAKGRCRNHKVAHELASRRFGQATARSFGSRLCVLARRAQKQRRAKENTTHLSFLESRISRISLSLSLSLSPRALERKGRGSAFTASRA